ncbi:MAG: hypothetical protein C0500_02470 [Sphingobium sp.]|nr:hypothetical protein [Sphingobium sp.]
MTGVKVGDAIRVDKGADPNDRSRSMTQLFDQPFLALAAAAVTIFALVLGYVSLTDRDSAADSSGA